MLLNILFVAVCATLSSGLPLEDGKFGANPYPLDPASRSLPGRGRDAGSLVLLSTPELVSEMVDIKNSARPGSRPFENPVYPRMSNVGIGETVTAVAGVGTSTGKGRHSKRYYGQTPYPYDLSTPQMGMSGFPGYSGSGGYGGYGYSPSGLSTSWNPQSSFYGQNPYTDLSYMGVGSGFGVYGDSYYPQQQPAVTPYIPSSSLYF